MKWMIYGWFEEGVDHPYFLSKCQMGSSVPFRDKLNIKAPTDRRNIRTIQTFDDEGEALEKLDRLVYLYGTVHDGTGTGLLENKNEAWVLADKSRKRPVTVYKDTGEKIADWPSVKDACDSLGVPRTGGYDSLHRRCYSIKGYVFVDQGRPMPPHPAGAPGRRTRKRGGNHPGNRPVWVYSADGEFLDEYQTIGLCSEALGLTRSDISGMVRGRVHTSKGYCVREKGVKWFPKR